MSQMYASAHDLCPRPICFWDWALSAEAVTRTPAPRPARGPARLRCMWNFPTDVCRHVEEKSLRARKTCFGTETVMRQQTVFEGANKTQYDKIRDRLPSFMPDRDTCNIARHPRTGRKVNCWITTFKCPCQHEVVQTKAYWKPGSTQDSLAAEMASKIDAVHAQHYCPQSTPTTGVYSNGTMVIAIAKELEQRNRDLTAQVRVVLGSS